MTITPHALSQYLRRSKTSEKHQVRAMEFLFSAAENGQRLPGNKHYHKGWIVVVLKDEIITAFRPNRVAVQHEVFNASNKKTVPSKP